MSEEKISEKVVGRNEPCPCGSNKKYKRCHGVDAAPKLTAPAVPASGAMAGGAMPGGFDPSQFDPAMLAQFSQMLQRLPKGQMQRLQGIMQKAMAGKDVTREAQEFERTLPVDVQQMLKTMSPQMMGGAMAGGAAPETVEAPEPQDMSVDEARKIVEKAVAEGKISREQADALLKK